MGKPIKVFEPITREQIVKINARAHEIGLPDPELYAMVAELAEIPLMTALSKQEAIALIERLEGNSERLYLDRPRYADAVEGDGANLAAFYHVRDIRLMFRELGWDREQITNWLVKYRKVKNIRSMDRRQARVTWSVLKGMVAGKTSAKAG